MLFLCPSTFVITKPTKSVYITKKTYNNYIEDVVIWYLDTYYLLQEYNYLKTKCKRVPKIQKCLFDLNKFANNKRYGVFKLKKNINAFNLANRRRYIACVKQCRNWYRLVKSSQPFAYKITEKYLMLVPERIKRLVRIAFFKALFSVEKDSSELDNFDIPSFLPQFAAEDLQSYIKMLVVILKIYASRLPSRDLCRIEQCMKKLKTYTRVKSEFIDEKENSRSRW